MLATVLLVPVLADRLIGSQGLNFVAMTGIIIALIAWTDAPDTAIKMMWTGGIFFGVFFLILTLLFLPPVGRWLLSRPWLPDEGWRGRIRSGIEAFHACTNSMKTFSVFLGISITDHLLSIGSCFLFARKRFWIRCTWMSWGCW